MAIGSKLIKWNILAAKIEVSNTSIHSFKLGASSALKPDKILLAIDELKKDYLENMKFFETAYKESLIVNNSSFSITI